MILRRSGWEVVMKWAMVGLGWIGVLALRSLASSICLALSNPLNGGVKDTQSLPLCISAFMQQDNRSER